MSQRVEGDLVEFANKTCGQLLEKVVKVLEPAAAARASRGRTRQTR